MNIGEGYAPAAILKELCQCPIGHIVTIFGPLNLRYKEFDLIKEKDKGYELTLKPFGPADDFRAWKYEIVETKTP